MSQQATLSTPESVVREIYEAMEQLETDRVTRLISEDTQAVDGVMVDWKRGLTELGAHVDTLEQNLSDEVSKLRDMVVREYGEIAVVTFVADQRYTLAGRRYEEVSPTTMVLRRDEDSWKLILFHSVPLPPAQ